MSERGSRHIVTTDEVPIPNPYTNQDELFFDSQPETEHTTIDAQPPEEYAAPPEAIEQPLTPEQQQDAANRFTDAELLGKSYRVQRLVSTIGNQRARTWEMSKAKVANAWDSPGKWIKQSLHDSANRKVEEINTDHKAARDAVLQSNVSKRLLDHRLARIDKKFNRKKEKWNSKLNERKTALSAHTSRMNARTELVKTNHEKRRAETIAYYKAAKVKAEARKSLRNELNAQGASWLEKNAIMKNLPQDQRKRIGEAALLAQASHRSAKTAERTAAQSERQASTAEQSLLANVARSEQLANRAKEADQSIEDITNVQLPEARANLSSLQEQLGQLPDDSPDRTALQVKIQEAEDKIKIYEERELPYWHGIAKHYREQVNTLLDERTALQQAHQTHQDTAAQHIEAAKSKRAAADEYARQHSAETNDLLNS